MAKSSYQNRPNNRTYQGGNYKQQPQVPANAISGPRLPYHDSMKERFGIDKSQWIALCDAIYPLATTSESIIMALSYCRARKLDPFKRVVHIVPIWNKNLNRMVDTIWPSIAELRTTAFRTGCYAGKGPTVYGPETFMTVGGAEVVVPEYVQITVYRFVNGQKIEFHGPRVYWIETYVQASKDDSTPNSMWSKRPRGQLEKCAEAAALRVGFPEECGNDYIPEELERSQVIEGVVSSPGVAHQTPSQSLDNLTTELESTSEQPEAENTSSPTQQPEASAPSLDIDAIARDLANCKTLTEVNDLISSLGEIPAEIDGPLASMEEQARERIRQQQAHAKSSQQGTLPGT